jgi:uncharacterized protein DUF5335
LLLFLMTESAQGNSLESELVMDSQLIPENQWVDFFDQFSRDHMGWPATIEVLDREVGPQRIAENLPLQGISLDTKGSRSCSIEVGAGDQPTRHISHLVDMPLHIRQAQEPNGSVILQIEPAVEPVTLIHVRGPIH